jgi:hypothetical protein
MSIERWTTTNNGITTSFIADVEVIANFVELCSYCGNPCTGTYRIWYIEGNKRMTFEVDQPSFSELLDLIVGSAIDREEYQSLPQFVREWNENTGWASIDLMDGSRISAEDLLRTTDLLGLHYGGSNAIPKILSLIQSLRDILLHCLREKREVWVGET